MSVTQGERDLDRGLTVLHAYVDCSSSAHDVLAWQVLTVNVRIPHGKEKVYGSIP